MDDYRDEETLAAGGVAFTVTMIALAFMAVAFAAALIALAIEMPVLAVSALAVVLALRYLPRPVDTRVRRDVLVRR